MKKFVLTCFFGMVALFGLGMGVAQAQDMTGTWQGTLDVGKGLRIVMQVSEGDGHGKKVVFRSIDQGGQALDANKVVVDGSSMKIDLLVLGGTWEGKISPDGTAFTGTFTQAGKPLPLNFVKATKATAWAIPEPPAKVPPMDPKADPGFEVATIKPAKPEEQGMGFRVQGRHFATINTTLTDLIEFAYGVHKKQIVGAPEWATEEKYDISGQPDQEGQPNSAQLKGMVKKLIAERFKVTFHEEKKELSVFAMTVTKDGPKMKKSESEVGGLPGLFFHPGAKGGLVFSVRNGTLTEVGSVMQSTVFDRPVADQTGLEGKWDFDLTFTPEEGQMHGMGGKLPPPPDGVEAPPSLFVAAPAQIGLRFEATKAPVKVMVLDHVEKPSQD